MLFFADRKSRKELVTRVTDVEDAIRQLEREFNNLALDTADLQDKARRMLNRANARARHADAKDEGGKDDNGELSADKLNQLIMEGMYDGNL